MGLIKCPDCGGTMQKIYGTKHETYYECIECGYGELMEKADYESDEYIDEDYEDEFEEFDIEDREDYDEIEDEEFDF